MTASAFQSRGVVVGGASSDLSNETRLVCLSFHFSSFSILFLFHSFLPSRADASSFPSAGSPKFTPSSLEKEPRSSPSLQLSPSRPGRITGTRSSKLSLSPIKSTSSHQHRRKSPVSSNLSYFLLLLVFKLTPLSLSPPLSLFQRRPQSYPLLLGRSSHFFTLGSRARTPSFHRRRAWTDRNASEVRRARVRDEGCLGDG